MWLTVAAFLWKELLKEGTLACLSLTLSCGGSN